MQRVELKKAEIPREVLNKELSILREELIEMEELIKPNLLALEDKGSQRRLLEELAIPTLIRIPDNDKFKLPDGVDTPEVFGKFYTLRELMKEQYNVSLVLARCGGSSMEFYLFPEYATYEILPIEIKESSSIITSREMIKKAEFLQKDLNIQSDVLSENVRAQFELKANGPSYMYLSCYLNEEKYEAVIKLLQRRLVIEQVASSSTSSTFFQTKKPDDVHKKRLQDKISVLTEEMKEIWESIKPIELEIKEKKAEIELLERLVNGYPIQLDSEKRLELPAVMGNPEILEKFYTLRQLMKAKFNVSLSSAEWDINSNTIEATQYLHYVTFETMHDEMKKAFEFLSKCAGATFELREPSMRSYQLQYILTEAQCEAGIKAINLITDMSPEKKAEIKSRPSYRC